jgi:competence protein ComEC
MGKATCPNASRIKLKNIVMPCSEKLKASIWSRVSLDVIIFLCAVGLVCFILSCTSPLAKSAFATDRQEMKVIFIDVGQGDSTLVILPNGKSILIDGGERDMGQVVLSTIKTMHVAKIDAIVATHPHADHIGGLITVMNQLPVDKVIDSGQDYTTNTYFDYLDAIDKHKISYQSVHDGDMVVLDQSVKIEVFNPPNPLINGSDDDISNNSVVLKMTYGNFSIVFPGDLKEAGEARLAGKKLDANVVLAAHHGSGHSNSIPFLRAASPETVIIYAGANNPYGFPSQQALSNFGTINVKHIFRTDIDGSVVLTTNGSRQYTMQTSKSEKTVVVVPEFNNPLLISSVVLLGVIILLKRRNAIWNRLK